MFMLFPLILPIYVTLRFLLPLPLSAPVKIAASLMLFAAALKQQFFMRFGGDFFSPELPQWLIVAYGCAFSALFLLFVFTLCKDIFQIVALSARFFFPRLPRFSLTSRAAAAISAFFLLLAVYGAYEAQRLPRVVEIKIPLANLPPEFENFKIALLCDLHISASRRADFARAVSERTNALSPDLILIAGDFIDGAREVRSGDVIPLAALRAPCGVLGIPGNHEYYFGADEWMNFFEEKLGIKMLLNAHALISRGNAEIAVAGLADEAARRFPERELPDVKKALWGIPAGVPIILLDHRPGAAKKNAAAGADLQLSGHTHGGMAPFLSPIVKKFNGGYLRGLYRVGTMKLYVSPGTGIWNGFLLRLFDSSEITVILLTALK
ncbi:MAG: metallophosphoesterase [Synergistes jonesii]|uniref:metallophosphoesterase n=1 Tax=Synergistes jonesii TaxID=2754 RepID=UPI002A761C19|nr:metallophosphoesterase [Synergistes jonesii]MDY2985048.1 metallophosphoesterase [Synergistes jonesii]